MSCFSLIIRQSHIKIHPCCVCVCACGAKWIIRHCFIVQECMLGKLGGICCDLILHVSRGGSALIESAPFHFISTGGIRLLRANAHGHVVSQTYQNSHADKHTDSRRLAAFHRLIGVCVCVSVCVAVHLRFIYAVCTILMACLCAHVSTLVICFIYCCTSVCLLFIDCVHVHARVWCVCVCVLGVSEVKDVCVCYLDVGETHLKCVMFIGFPRQVEAFMYQRGINSHTRTHTCTDTHTHSFDSVLSKHS